MLTHAQYCAASNLLINREGQVKLADFGLATNYRTREKFGCNVVTLWYRAPELLLGDTKYGPAVDVWSAGCIFGELALRQPLFRGRDEDEQLRLIFSICGTPNDDQWPGTRRARALSMRHILKSCIGVTRLPGWNATWRSSAGQTLAARFQQALPADAVQLMQRLLCMNPNERVSGVSF